MNLFSLENKAFFVGFCGDFGLQLISKYKGDIVGLKNYFKQHGSLESMFIAGGMMYLFALIYVWMGFPKKNIYLFIYGGILDIIFRNFGLSTSLNNTYYKNISPINSFIWGGLPFVMINLL
jgi:hypothetical protein